MCTCTHSSGPQHTFFCCSSSVCSQHCTPVSRSFRQDLYLHHNLSSQTSWGPDGTLALPYNLPSLPVSFLLSPTKNCFLFPPPGVAPHAPQIPVLHTSPHTLASLSSFACYLGPQHSLPASFLPVHSSPGKVTFLNCKSFGGSWSILCKLLIALGTQAPGLLSGAHVAGQCPTSDLTCLMCAVLRCSVVSDSLQLPGL